MKRFLPILILACCILAMLTIAVFWARSYWYVNTWTRNHCWAINLGKPGMKVWTRGLELTIVQGHLLLLHGLHTYEESSNPRRVSLSFLNSEFSRTPAKRSYHMSYEVRPWVTYTVPGFLKFASGHEIWEIDDATGIRILRLNIRDPDTMIFRDRMHLGKYGLQLPMSSGEYRSLQIPLWFPFTISLIIALFAARKWRQDHCLRLRPKLGLCLTCGYDLRATPHRCPECGNVPTTIM
ncbi:MAG: hypothetical protein FWD53_09030 [Phycisphaerales bacterium]|nr:hypothetical protein [Phycisphaerales bacterium]